MSLLYNVAIHVYAAGVRLAAIKHRKAALMVQGHRETLARIAEVRRNVAPEGFDVWIHAASLGEFEQARPLISMIRRQQPHKSILLSFFSPSGYTVRHAYPDVDLVVYLPLIRRATLAALSRRSTQRLQFLSSTSFGGICLVSSRGTTFQRILFRLYSDPHKYFSSRGVV